ncbi:MAG: hypothetical protein RI980_817 [Bacteroidota bacterium]|jgi:pimeloyl-ACP methyl ester carboxylesterase
MYKKIIITSIFLFGSLSQLRAQFVTQEMKARPADYEYLSAPDSLGVRNQLLMPNVSNKNVLATQNLPYPIIFIHGLNSNELIWGNTSETNLMYNFFQSQNLTFGGRFDFNLNYDNNNTISNKFVWNASTPNADIAFYTSSAVAADYYFVNFDVGSNGAVHPGGLFSTDVLSNQSAIAKQGIALKIVIQQVMSITGRDKVILMGHSMGGLAAREYLQNPENWKEPYINHHVAKLVTTGTPHGGSNSTAPFLVTLYNGLNNRSEAMRDLKKTYSNSNANGVFLFGGYEFNFIMDDGSNLYYNVDVNCNGSSGDLITGLNNKSFNNNIDYAYIIGICGTCTLSPGFIDGDGVVPIFSSNFSNFNTNILSPKNEFNYEASSSIQIHTDLPKQIFQNMQGLDEPNHYALSYGIHFNKIYKGFITQQPVGGYTVDYDDYIFTMPYNGTFSISGTNSFSNNLPFQILDSSYNIIYSNTILPFSTNSFSLILTSGQYYLEFFATPTNTSYQYPYNFILSSVLSSETFDSNISLNIHPNPTNSKVFFDNTNSNFNDVVIYNYLGQEVGKSRFLKSVNNQEIDLTSFAPGIYVLRFSNQGSYQSVKIIKQ